MKTIILSSLISLSCFAGPTHFLGKAMSSKDKSHLYNEDHRVEYSGDLVQKVVTTYSDPTGKEIAKLVSTFKGNHQLPDTEFYDKRNGIKEETKLVGSKYVIITTDTKGKTKKGTLDVDSNLVCGQGYHNYIISNLDSFKVGEKRELKFIIPSMRDYFTFDLTYLGPIEKDRPDEVSFRLDITNWILSMFADKIQVTYSKKNKTLLRYEGLTNLKNQKGDQFDAILTYTFPESKK